MRHLILTSLAPAGLLCLGRKPGQNDWVRDCTFHPGLALLPPSTCLGRCTDMLRQRPTHDLSPGTKIMIHHERQTTSKDL